MLDPAHACPLRFFDTLPDPRVTHVRHRLMDLLVMAWCAVICDADGWDGMADFAKAKADWFATFMDLEHGVPSADTFRRVISRLDPDAFERCFMAWMAAPGSGGRAVAGTTGRGGWQEPPPILRAGLGQERHGPHGLRLRHAPASGGGQTLGQLKTDAKGKELEGITQLLGLIDLSGATVTIDAMGCQKSIARQITHAGGDYVLAVKQNHKTLHRKVKVELDDMIRMGFQGAWHDRCEEVDAGRTSGGGRIETRRVWTTHEPGWLKVAGDWPGLRSVVCVEARREVIGQEPSVERRYYITSLAPDAAALGGAIRGHPRGWGGENRLHHVPDVSFHEDDSRIRRDHGPQNVSRLRRIALNLLKAADGHTKRKSIKGRRKIAGWDDQFLLHLIAG